MRQQFEDGDLLRLVKIGVELGVLIENSESEAVTSELRAIHRKVCDLYMKVAFPNEQAHEATPH